MNKIYKSEISIVEDLSKEASWIRNRCKNLFISKAFAMNKNLIKRINTEFNNLYNRRDEILKQALLIKQYSINQNYSIDLLIEICKRSSKEFSSVKIV